MTRRRSFPPMILAGVFLVMITLHAYAAETDTDGDGLPDAVEDANGNTIVDEGETNPFDADTDGGGESDGSEITGSRNPHDLTDDLTHDADGDGWVNGTEKLYGTDPLKKDTDGDLVIDPKDAFPLDPTSGRDDNKNGLPDEWEEKYGLGSNASPTDDPDGDGMTNLQEFQNGTDPMSADTDGDGLIDTEEVADGTNPRENACLSFGPITPEFDDMNGHWSRTVVSRLTRTRVQPADAPIVKGYLSSAGTGALFLPDRAVTRFEFLKMVLASTCIPLATAGNDDIHFSDVTLAKDELDERSAVIITAVEKKIATGYENRTFKPDAPVNRAEAVAILMRAARLDAPKEAANITRLFPDIDEKAWYKSPLSVAVWREIVKGYDDGKFHPERSITRAEAAKIIYLTMMMNPWVNGYVLPEL